MKLLIQKLLKIQIFKKLDALFIKKLALLFQNGFSIQQISNILNIDDLYQDENIQLLFKKYPVITSQLSLKDSSNFIASYQLFLDEIKKTINKVLAYPLLLLFAANFILIFFKRYFIPQIAASLPLVLNEINTYIQIINVIMIVEVVLVFLTIIIIFLIRKPIVLNYFYEILYQKNQFKIILDYYSLRFLIIFKKLLDLGLTTQEIMYLMTKMKNERIISYLAYHFKNTLELGTDFILAVSNLKINHDLKEVLLISFYSSNKLSILDDYTVTLKESFILNLNKLATKLQYFSYCLVSLFIVLMYQIISLPLKSINQI